MVFKLDAVFLHGCPPRRHHKLSDPCLCRLCLQEYAQAESGKYNGLLLMQFICFLHLMPNACNYPFTFRDLFFHLPIFHLSLLLLLLLLYTRAAVKIP